MPQLLQLPVFERERIICELEASLPHDPGHPTVSDEEVARRLAEIEADPEGSTVSAEEFQAYFRKKLNR